MPMENKYFFHMYRLKNAGFHVHCALQAQLYKSLTIIYIFNIFMVTMQVGS